MSDSEQPRQPEDAGAEQDALPEAPLFALLRTVAAEVGPDRVDQVWLFPPRRLKAGETAVAVVSALLELDQPDRRRVLAAHYTAPADAAVPPRLALEEYGTAPADRIGRVVEDVVERFKDGPPEAPRAYPIGADPERWDRLLHELAEAYLAEAEANPRLRP